MMYGSAEAARVSFSETARERGIRLKQKTNKLKNHQIRIRKTTTTTTTKQNHVHTAFALLSEFAFLEESLLLGLDDAAATLEDIEAHRELIACD
jgi:hypothetical protein